MTIDTKDIVTTVAYLIGVRKELIIQNYDEVCHELIENLCQDKNATIIRYLSKLKTVLLKNFKKTDTEMRFNLANIDRLEWFDNENIKKLEEWGIKVVQVNYRSDQYMEDFTRLINEHIDGCRHLFADWVNFDYIKDLFCVPDYQKKGILKNEFEKFMGNMMNYPFKMYIHWKPAENGNILYNDYKFLKTVYAQHNDYFYDISKVHDAGDETKESIYDFIDKAQKAAIVVDCENSDVFKLYGVLRNCDLSKIEKIMLYDDIHTSTAWDWLSKYTKIPVEHIEVERVTEAKSLVDIKMTAGVCTEFYTGKADSFILCSSDSDFWGLISSLPQARFLVMYEYTKCGEAIKEALNEHGIYNCSMDDFYTGNATELKRNVLLDRLEQHLDNLLGQNGKELARTLYEETRITYTNQDIENFYNKYIKTLRLKEDSEGRFFIEVLKM